MKLYFISSNRFKINEVKNILESDKISVIAVSQKIHEIQSENMIEIVKSKATEAFKRIRRPLLVEQTGLLIKDFGNLPGGLTQIFWDSLQADKFGEIFSNGHKERWDIYEKKGSGKITLLFGGYEIWMTI